MKRDITPYHLGGSLYLPATHKDLLPVVCSGKIPGLKSVIIDFEDAIASAELEAGHEAFERLLKESLNQALLVFVRPRSVKHLKALLRLEGIEKIDGFVLAKCDTTNMQPYFRVLKSQPFWVMPVLESAELFEPKKLSQMERFFSRHFDMILSLRFGGEDISSRLGLKRRCDQTLYDLPAVVQLLSTLVLRFKPKGFNISAPVFTCFKNGEGFGDEVVNDLNMGLFSKTLIHPSQVEAVNRLYRPTLDEYESALKVTQKDASALISHNGMMLETVPHRRWAQAVLMRKELYGVA